MKNLTSLPTSLLDKFKIDSSKSQAKNVIRYYCGILVKETVNLNKLKNQPGFIVDNTQTTPGSHYRRLTRFFDDRFCRFVLWKWILKKVIQELILRIDKRSGGRYLLMDGTCWEFGKAKFHFLTLSIVYQGVSIPFFFVNLSKKGLSTSDERRRVFQMAHLLYPLKGMTLLADREYIGREWFACLVNEFELNFIIRLPESAYKKELDEQKKYYGQLIRNIRKGKIVDVGLVIGENRFRFIGKKNPNPENKSDDLTTLDNQC